MPFPKGDFVVAEMRAPPWITVLPSSALDGDTIM